jgi:hypothetical protein
MRTLGFALVVVSLAFTVGGVAIVGRADSKGASSSASEQSVAPDQSVAPTQSVAPPGPYVSPVAKALPGQCAPLKTTRQPKLYGDARKMALPKGAIPLNTHGYNYGAQEMGQLPPDVRPEGAPPAAPAKP